MKAYYNSTIITGGKIYSGKALLTDGGTIKGIVNENEIPPLYAEIDLNGNYLAPGFVDLQVYGAGDTYFFGGNPSLEALKDMDECLLGKGTTFFLATIPTANEDVVRAGIAAAKGYRSQFAGAFRGLHLEGPYINPKRRGAHPEEFIHKATQEEVRQLLKLAEGLVKMISLAPELQDASVMDYLSNENILISAGHSNASYSEAKKFLNHPVKAVTHLFNGMPPLHHREPGLIAAVFDERPYTSIVADGIHVDFTIVRMAKKLLNDRLFLISDAASRSESGAYLHRLAGDHFELPDGTISGSALTMLQAVANCVRFAGVEIAEAVDMATRYPALLMGEHLHGTLAAGAVANMVIFDQQFNHVSTVFGGELIPAVLNI